MNDCPCRVGDHAQWENTHGGVTCVCTGCGRRVPIASWAHGDLPTDGQWMIVSHIPSAAA